MSNPIDDAIASVKKALGIGQNHEVSGNKDEESQLRDSEQSEGEASGNAVPDRANQSTDAQNKY